LTHVLFGADKLVFKLLLARLGLLYLLGDTAEVFHVFPQVLKLLLGRVELLLFLL
jgi:hypothetical protein